MTSAERGQVVRIHAFNMGDGDDAAFKATLQRVFDGFVSGDRPVNETVRLEVVTSRLIRSRATATRESVL